MNCVAGQPGVGDYVALSMLLTFTPASGSQQRCTNVTILDNDVVESTEHFLVMLDASENDAEHIDFPLAAANVSVMDDDSKSFITDSKVL